MRTARAVIAILILSGADACGGGDGVTTPTTPGGTTTQCADIGAVSNAPTPVSLWTQLQPTGTAPVARIAVAAALDAANDRLIVFGGKSAAGVLNDVWVLTNATGVSGTPAWTQLTPTGGPPTARNYAVATYDPASNRFSVYGGNNQSNLFLSDYWVLTNANGQGGTPVWSQVTPAGLPSARAQSAGASDPAGNRMLVFGGVACNSSSCTPYNDAYVASNASGATGTPTFTRLQGTGTNPAARYDATIAYDAAGNRMLMFGGQPSTSTSSDPSLRVADTWALSSANGTGAAAAWSLINTGTTTPPGREFHSAIYDATNTRLVIFGGAGTDNFTRSDTWTLTTSGTSGTWTSYAQNSSPRPAARSAHAATYSPQQGRMVVFGGNLGASQYVNEVWVLRLTTTTVASVTILSAATSVCANNTLKLVAVPRDASGTVVDAAVTWTSSDPGILNVGSDGTVTGIAAGTATATACVGSVCGTQSVRITAAAVTPGGGTVGYQYWKGDIPNSYYTLNFYGERARKVTGKPFMVLTYDKITLQITDCEFGLSEVTQVAITNPSNSPAAPEPTLEAGSIDYQTKLNLKSPVDLIVGWKSKSSINNGSLNGSPTFSFNTGSSPGGVGHNELWSFSNNNVSMWGDVKNIDTTYYLGRDSDSKAFSLLKL